MRSKELLKGPMLVKAEQGMKYQQFEPRHYHALFSSGLVCFFVFFWWFGLVWWFGWFDGLVWVFGFFGRFGGLVYFSLAWFGWFGLVVWFGWWFGLFCLVV